MIEESIPSGPESEWIEGEEDGNPEAGQEAPGWEGMAEDE